MDAGEPFFRLFDCSLPLATDRAGKPLSWTNERAETLFVCE
jgi:hypothetical protein